MPGCFQSVGEAEAIARAAANQIRNALGFKGNIDASVFLGTGWADAFPFERSVPLEQIAGFRELPKLEGHPRDLALVEVDGKRILLHRGRVHMYERGGDEDISRMVRTQAELDLHLGVKHVVLTCAAGGLNKRTPTGSIVLIDGFVTLFVDLSRIGGLFCSAEDALIDLDTRNRLDRALRAKRVPVSQGGYVMVKGPAFEGRKYDKPFLSASDAACVGMSTIPEALVVDIYNKRGLPKVGVTALAFISNDDVEEHSHQVNLDRARKQKTQLRTTLITVLNELFKT